MKKIVIVTASALAILLCANTTSFSIAKGLQTSTGDTTKKKMVMTKQIFNLDTTKVKKGEKFYQCEMDHTIISNKPGSCTKCGMFLTEIKKK